MNDNTGMGKWRKMTIGSRWGGMKMVQDEGGQRWNGMKMVWDEEG